MSARRIKEYLMQAIPDSLGGERRYRAYFVGDGYSVNAFDDILPSVIETGGIKVSGGVATDLIKSFLKSCVSHTATTGETVNIADLMTVTLAIKGSYERRKSSASRDNVRVVVRLLNEMRPTVSFSMSNAITGKVVTLHSVTSPGCEPGFVKQGGMATLNGLNLEMLEGDSLTATMKNAAKETVTIQCAYVSTGSTRLDVTIPAEFSDPFYVGKEITFKIMNRCGDPESEQDSDTITATLLAAGVEPTPTPQPTLTDVYSREDEPGTIMQDEAFQLIGTNLTLGEGDKVEAQLADAEDPDHWYDLTGTATNLDAERIRLSDLAWETLGPDVQVSTDHPRVKFRVTIGGKSAEIVANAAVA